MQYPCGWVSPFGHCRIKACCQLPDTFRRLPRPSSPLTAKASTVCAYSLDHITPSRLGICRCEYKRLSLQMLKYLSVLRLSLSTIRLDLRLKRSLRPGLSKNANRFQYRVASNLMCVRRFIQRLRREHFSG